MNNMIENLINGNCTDARRLARKYSYDRIHAYLYTELGWTREASHCAAYFLKTGNGFQAYCDATEMQKAIHGFDAVACASFIHF